MNQSFSFQRLWLLILKQGMENSRFYLLFILSTLVVTALFAAFWLFFGDGDYQERELYTFSFIALSLCGTVFASTQFDFLARKNQGIYWLSFPVSHLEKLICAIFYTFFMFNLLFTVCFVLCRWLAISYVESGVIADKFTFVPLEVPFYQTSHINYIYVFIALQALYLLGSVYFGRFSFVKTTVVAAALILGFSLYIKMLDKSMLGGYYYWDGLTVRPIMPEKIDGIDFYKIYSLPNWMSASVVWLLRIGWAPVFWVITWKRLTEKEI